MRFRTVRNRLVEIVVFAIVVGATLPSGYLLPMWPYPEDAAALPQQFELLCWNTYKRAEAIRELQEHGEDPDVICLQEWSSSMPRNGISADNIVPGSTYGGHFGRSWRLPFGQATGVATLSRVRPSTMQYQRSWWRELWFFTPKCALATTYPIEGRDEELLVVNIHAIQIQWLTYMLREQVGGLRDIVANHEGPVIVCGDFNTWRRDRLKIVRDAFPNLEEVEFGPGRTTGKAAVWLLFGNRELALDRVFYGGGLEVVGGTGTVGTSDVSDHHPLRVLFRVGDR